MEIPRHWRLKKQRYWWAKPARTVMARFFRRDVCPHCGGGQTPMAFSGRKGVSRSR